MAVVSLKAFWFSPLLMDDESDFVQLHVWSKATRAFLETGGFFKFYFYFFSFTKVFFRDVKNFTMC